MYLPVPRIPSPLVRMAAPGGMIGSAVKLDQVRIVWRRIHKVFFEQPQSIDDNFEAVLGVFD